MRQKLVAMAALALAATGAWAMPEGWTDDFDAAKEKAKAEGKLILADFSGSDWCGWCMKLDKEVFSKKEFVEAAQRDFVLVMIDSPSDKMKLSRKAKKQNPKLVEKYGIKGFPTVLVLDAEGNRLHKTGYREGGPGPYLEKLAEVKKAVDSGEDLAAQELDAEALEKMSEDERTAAVDAAMRKHWTNDLGAARAQAAREGKCMLMYFYSSSGHSSRNRELEEQVLSKENFFEAAKKDYVLVAIEVPTEKTKLPKETRIRNMRIARTFDAETWLPALKILDSDGIEIATMTSFFRYRGGTKEFLNYIANKRAATEALRELFDSIHGLESGDPERIAKIDRFLQGIGIEEAEDDSIYSDLAEELAENDDDDKFAAKYPYLIHK